MYLKNGKKLSEADKLLIEGAVNKRVVVNCRRSWKPEFEGF